jgi:Tol biopolymer transport system component
VWSPDGKYIAYGAQTGGNWDVWVSSGDGNDHHRLTEGEEMETNPKWSPDGSKMAYKMVAAGDYNLTVEQFMTFENGFDSPEIYIWNGPQSIQMSDWSPDGSHITYTAEVVDYVTDNVSYLAAVSDLALGKYFAEGQPALIAGGETLGDRGPVFSPDGRRIAFWAWDLSYRATLWMVNTDGTNLRQMTYAGFDMYPRWKPSGEKLLFESNRNGNMDIWVLSID